CPQATWSAIPSAASPPSSTRDSASTRPAPSCAMSTRRFPPSPSNRPHPATALGCTRRARSSRATPTRPWPGTISCRGRGPARMNQAISILDSYAYRPLVWDIFVARSRPSPDEGAIALAATRADGCVAALEDLMEDAPFLAGQALTLADLHAAPMIAYVRRTPG